MLNTKGISLACFLFLVSDRESEAAFGNVDNLRMGMAVNRSNSSFCEFIDYTHSVIAVSHYFANYSGGNAFPTDIIGKQPLSILMILAHLFFRITFECVLTHRH